MLGEYNDIINVLNLRAGQKETYYINKNEKLHQKVKDLKAYGREAHSKCKELSRILQQVEEENKQLKQARHDGANNVSYSLYMYRAKLLWGTVKIKLKETESTACKIAITNYDYMYMGNIRNIST